MRREWEPEDLIACWTLVEEDWPLVANKAGATRLGFAVMLKYFELEARFPRHAGDVPRAAIDYVARQVNVDPSRFADYDWTGRTVERHRSQVRRALGFEEATVGDENRLAMWLAEEVCGVELKPERLRDALLARCRADRIEPPGPSRIERTISAAQTEFDRRFTTRTGERLGPSASEGLDAMVNEVDGADSDTTFLAQLKSDPGQISLDTMLDEIAKLERVRRLGLPGDLFDGEPERLVQWWRARASRLYPSDLRASPEPIRLTLLATLCWVRTTELVDGLVDLMIAIVHKIDARAERRAEAEFVRELKQSLRGKEKILFRMAAAAIEHPDDTVRRALFPVVDERTLRDLVRESKANATTYSTRVRTVLRGSYSNHYRRGLPRLLGALEFRSNNTIYRPVIDALELLARYADLPGNKRFYDPAEVVPIEGVIPKDWRAAVIDDAGRVERVPYELCVLKALRDAVRRREIWVAGATRWRNPEDDLPADFEDNRDVHYGALRQPLDPAQFIDVLKRRHIESLDQLGAALREGRAGAFGSPPGAGSRGSACRLAPSSPSRRTLMP